MPALTIRDLLPWLIERGGTVVAGAQYTGLDRSIEGVARPRRIIAREIDAFDAHDLIFASLAAFGNSDITIEQFVQTVADTQAGLLLIGSPVQSPSSQLVTLADTLAFPLLSLPTSIDATEIARQLVDFIHLRQTQAARYVRETMTALGTARRSATPLLATATALAEKTNAVFIIEDEYRVSLLRIIPQQFPLDEEEVASVLSSYSARQVVRPATPGGVIDDIPPQRRLPLSMSRIIMPVRAETSVVAYISLLGREEHLSPYLADVLSQIMPMVVSEIDQLRQPIQSEQRSSGTDLDALFADTLPEDEMFQRARTYGYDLALPHQVLVGKPMIAENDRLLDVWARSVRDIVGLPLWYSNSNGEVTMLLRTSIATSEVVKQLWQRCTESGMKTLGIGTPATMLAGLRRSLFEAQQAANAGTLITEGGVTYYADLGVMRLLYPLVADGGLIFYARDTLAPLLGADNSNNDNLLKTLDIWFAVHGNMTEAARRLNLHRNTLIYRLNNIQEALGSSLDDAELRLSLQLALKIWRTFPNTLNER